MGRGVADRVFVALATKCSQPHLVRLSGILRVHRRGGGHVAAIDTPVLQKAANCETTPTLNINNIRSTTVAAIYRGISVNPSQFIRIPAFFSGFLFYLCIPASLSSLSPSSLP